MKAAGAGLDRRRRPDDPPDQVEAFKKEMAAAGAKVEVVSYPGAKHGFTNPDAGKFGMDGARLQRRGRQGVLGADAQVLRRGVREEVSGRR